MTQRLKGKLVMVTGGASGIGKAICEVFAREGACIAIVDINETMALDTLKLLKGSNHCVIQADVSKAQDVKRAFEIAEEILGGKCDVLVNNAGILGDHAFVTEKDESAFDKIINVNLKGYFLVAKEFLSSVKTVDKEVRGVLINMASLAAKVGFPGNFEYGASKAGVVSLTKTIAAEFPVHRVRCNVVLPGSTDVAAMNKMDPEVREVVKNKIVMKRFAREEEIANVFLFLASEESSYVHGSSLEVTGGLAA